MNKKQTFSSAEEVLQHYVPDYVAEASEPELTGKRIAAEILKDFREQLRKELEYTRHSRNEVSKREAGKE